MEKETVQCECGEHSPVETSVMNDDGCWSCAECVKEWEKECERCETLLREVGFEYLYVRLNRYEGDWFPDEIATYLTKT